MFGPHAGKLNLDTVRGSASSENAPRRMALAMRTQGDGGC
jgi:hypothetical protein